MQIVCSITDIYCIVNRGQAASGDFDYNGGTVANTLYFSNSCKAKRWLCFFVSFFLYCDRNGSGGCEFVPAAAVFACGYKWSAKEIYGMAVAVVFFADRVSDPDFQYV